MRKVVLIGDSTIDNQVWIDSTRREKDVSGHLRDALGADFEVVNHANDGFTTHDVLEGNFRDKVFGDRHPDVFPHVKFSPLKDPEPVADIQTTDCIVLSVGGNNFREFLGRVGAMAAAGGLSQLAIPAYIQMNLHSCIAQVKREYNEILKRLRKLNPTAKIILSTQYYPSVDQENYNIYTGMYFVGKYMGWNATPTRVISRLVEECYGEIIRESSDVTKNIVVADTNASLNPHDSANFACQIEPANRGGEKMAHLLSHVIQNGKAGECLFLNDGGDVERSSLIAWKATLVEVFSRAGRNESPVRVGTRIFPEGLLVESQLLPALFDQEGRLRRLLEQPYPENMARLVSHAFAVLSAVDNAAESTRSDRGVALLSSVIELTERAFQNRDNVDALLQAMQEANKLIQKMHEHQSSMKMLCAAFVGFLMVAITAFSLMVAVSSFGIATPIAMIVATTVLIKSVSILGAAVSLTAAGLAFTKTDYYKKGAGNAIAPESEKSVEKAMRKMIGFFEEVRGARVSSLVDPASLLDEDSAVAGRPGVAGGSSTDENSLLRSGSLGQSYGAAGSVN